jgi:hypothetical protein
LLELIDAMTPEQRTRAVRINAYKKNPAYCKNTPGSHSRDPLGCMPGYTETAPLRFDNREQDFCDRCRRVLEVPSVVEKRGGNRGTSKNKRQALKEAQHRLRVKKGYVQLNGLLNAKVESGMTYGDIATRCGLGYTLNTIRDWAVLSSYCPSEKVGKIAEVLGVTEEYLKTAKK